MLLLAIAEKNVNQKVGIRNRHLNNWENNEKRGLEKYDTHRHIDFNRDREKQRVTYLTILRKRVVEERIGY